MAVEVQSQMALRTLMKIKVAAGNSAGSCETIAVKLDHWPKIKSSDKSEDADKPENALASVDAVGIHLKLEYIVAESVGICQITDQLIVLLNDPPHSDKKLFDWNIMLVEMEVRCHNALSDIGTLMSLWSELVDKGLCGAEADSMYSIREMGRRVARVHTLLEQVEVHIKDMMKEV
ncbi:hypothetical protein K431DRAFT_113028 [Polychaeton citri CBS 116435]|uniref:Uncharacterized protein n=1 Tax=Polychaeton citri CBS 116435 TaxID=1314669 RepID=A0A9P4UMA4_9PEZI|nr:hypothetical protein K431DRAFT_113028 [Polychaeton citri CBS 116435]